MRKLAGLTLIACLSLVGCSQAYMSEISQLETKKSKLEEEVVSLQQNILSLKLEESDEALQKDDEGYRREQIRQRIGELFREEKKEYIEKNGEIEDCPLIIRRARDGNKEVWQVYGVFKKKGTKDEEIRDYLYYPPENNKEDRLERVFPGCVKT